MSMGYTHANYLRLGVAAPTPHAPRATANRPAPLQAGARSTRRGLRVGVLDSLGLRFVEGLQSWSAFSVAGSTSLSQHALLTSAEVKQKILKELSQARYHDIAA